MPGVANAVTQREPFATLAKAVAGIDRRRQLPAFAPLSLQQWWFAARGGTTNPTDRGWSCGPTPSTTTSTPRIARR